ncbi:hypothetical protein U1Q18_019601 [Sarracenia purpurea var. burkii]
MALSGSSSYYLHRGIGGSGSASGSGYGSRPEPNPNISVHPNVRDSSVGTTFPFQSSSPSFPHGFDKGASSGVPMADPVKKKRGRPRKYGPDGTNMSLGLSPMSVTPPSGLVTPTTEKRGRGRPPGSGWKQQLAPLGEWMNSSAGLAFAPHVINIAVGEGRFQILCLSGSYLVAETGGPHNRTGGLSISFCTPDGHVIGGGVGGMLIAGSPVQVVVCSFVYGGSKLNHKAVVGSKGEENYALQPSEKLATPTSVATSQYLTPNSSSAWPGSRPDLRDLQSGIDLMRG